MAERLTQKDDTFLYGHEVHIQRYRFVAGRCDGKVVLDAGCGIGYGARELIRKGAREVIGVDLSSEALAEAKAATTSDRIRFLQADLENLPGTSGIPDVVDVVVNLENLEHLHHPDRFLAGARARLRRPDGILITTTPNGVLTKFDQHGNNVNPYHIKEFTHQELVEILSPHFSHIDVYGQWETNDRKLRLVEEYRAFQFLCSMYYDPFARMGRRIRRLLGRPPSQAPEFLGAGATYSWEHVIAPLVEAPYPWEPTVLIAVCSG